MSDYTLIFDGGAKNNGSPQAEAYGSYQIRTADGRQETVRLRFPGPPARTGQAGTTSNEAEYNALIRGVMDLMQRIAKARRSCSEFDLRIVGDSALVLNQVQGTWKCKVDRLRVLRDYAQAQAGCFKSVEYTWKPRGESVEVLGH